VRGAMGSAPDTTVRARRSCLSVPGSSPKMLAKAATLPADEVFVDLEDAVAPELKNDETRGAVVEALRGDWLAPTRGVRVNAVAPRRPAGGGGGAGRRPPRRVGAEGGGRAGGPLRAGGPPPRRGEARRAPPARPRAADRVAAGPARDRADRDRLAADRDADL